jgi:hypothetical protein
MAAIVERNNLRKALARVKANKGAERGIRAGGKAMHGRRHRATSGVQVTFCVCWRASLAGGDIEPGTRRDGREKGGRSEMENLR